MPGLLPVFTLRKWRSSIGSLLSLLLRRLLRSCPPSEGRLAGTRTSLFRAESCGPHLSPLGSPQFSYCYRVRLLFSPSLRTLYACVLPQNQPEQTQHPTLPYTSFH